MSNNTTSNRPYLQAIAGERLPHPPVWLMRQAGRYLPEYLKVREAHSFLDCCNDPELICEITMQPIRRFGFDAAILFSDILIPLVPMGADLSFDKGHGPRIANPVRTEAGVAWLKGVHPASDLHQVLDGIQLLRKTLPTDTALIGFAGAPFTLSTYLIEGEKPDPFVNVKKMMYREPDVFAALQEKLGVMVADYLIAQYQAGADAVQVFDTWAGISSESEFRRVTLPTLKTIFFKLRSVGVPSTYFVKDGNHLLNAVAELDCDVIGVDWKTSIRQARKAVGQARTIQGNLDPTTLFGDEASIRAEVRRVLDDAGSEGRHIFNLGHGILPSTPIESVETLLDEVRRG